MKTRHSVFNIKNSLNKKRKPQSNDADNTLRTILKTHYKYITRLHFHTQFSFIQLTTINTFKTVFIQKSSFRPNIPMAALY